MSAAHILLAGRSTTSRARPLTQIACMHRSRAAGFGQIIQRSSDGGKTWETPGGEVMPRPDAPPAGQSNKFVYDTSEATGKPLTTHQWYDGTQHPWEFKRVWHLEPSLTDPDEVYAGVEDAA